ncbi:hypothetical protein IscW_ISCW014771 [Ixodes scapularis]|uniref:Uncharacterized protein n=1 Tax=Ixodes scapularis TaxID=6945 RepID=B7QJB8_IXOSC|nr:hypothetical protein IscW_ISCW014771 [Ixodes scapularis]|eukprot:XP_002415275.1 hypothetical protein IscW_ISCW014771 [Ixodes scapularis]
MSPIDARPVRAGALQVGRPWRPSSATARCAAVTAGLLARPTTDTLDGCLQSSRSSATDAQFADRR